ncbi:unnamed protein product [Acanthoscelides obtectus]|uniref:Uncharacterized protein n=1 Tax=Acanthoscelides obtectus TaxID=200917 RepID=A0A9P0PE03_ACAOB|nr:unnamed protein product [Acanthoscelides obtectus]CAK1656170.1 hypothetical protein AOBTE_LOCUS19600 [Acanthoscelides obtectus]
MLISNQMLFRQYIQTRKIHHLPRYYYYQIQY